MNKKWIHIAFCVCLVLAALLASGRTAFAQPLDNGTDVVVSVLSEGVTGEFRFKFRVTKDYSTSPLSGCKFQLTTGRYGAGEIIRDTGDFTESPAGTYSFSCQLEYGQTYYLYEKSAPSGYGINAGFYYTIEIGNDGKVFYSGQELSASASNLTYEFTMSNHSDPLSKHDSSPTSYFNRQCASIYKIDAETKEYLPGASFKARSTRLSGQYSNEYPYVTSEYWPNKKYDAHETPYYQFNIRINNDYELQETQAPDGYAKDDTVYTMMIDGNGLTKIYKPDGSELEKMDGNYVIPSASVRAE